MTKAWCLLLNVEILNRPVLYQWILGLIRLEEVRSRINFDTCLRMSHFHLCRIFDDWAIQNWLVGTLDTVFIAGMGTSFLIDSKSKMTLDVIEQRKLVMILLILLDIYFALQEKRWYRLLGARSTFLL